MEEAVVLEIVAHLILLKTAKSFNLLMMMEPNVRFANLVMELKVMVIALFAINNNGMNIVLFVQKPLLAQHVTQAI